MMRSSLASVGFAVAWSLACTITIDHGTTPGFDAGIDADTTDGGADGGAYPAFTPDMPTVVNQKGATLKTPKFVTVTWASDPSVASFEAFGAAIGASPYWSATTKEYGIGPATNTNVHVTTPAPASWNDADLDTWLSTQVSAAPGNGWPAADDQTAYLIYVPATTTFTVQGQPACPNTDGYHDETTAGTAQHVPYAVVIEECHAPQTVVEFSTETASHELVEMATDPHTQSDTAWIGVDADHYAWELWVKQQDELADLCQDMDDVYYHEAAPLDYRVQRTWSNAAALAGHHPCAPAPTIPYFNTTPLGTEPVTFTMGGKTIKSKGYGIAVGQTRTITVGLYSDAPTDAWNVSFVEGDHVTPPALARLSFGTPSVTKGTNGDVITVSVTLNSIGKDTGVLATIVSTRGTEVRGFPFIVTAL